MKMIIWKHEVLLSKAKFIIINGKEKSNEEKALVQEEFLCKMYKIEDKIYNNIEVMRSFEKGI
ncbi:MAG: hypothetical protein QM683_13445 [Lacrimispora sp.]